MFVRSTWRHISSMLLLLLAGFAHGASPPPDAVQRAFANLRIFLSDVPPPEGLPLSNTAWRIVQAANESDALMASNVLAEGITNLKGEALLSSLTRTVLANAWRQTAGPMWLIHDSQVYQLVLQREGAAARIEFVSANELADAARQRAESEQQAELTKPVDPLRFVQPNYDAATGKREFEEWRQRFQDDLTAFRLHAHQDPAWSKALLADESGEGLRQVFNRSIDDGLKGLSLRAMLVAAVHTSNRRVYPPGVVFAMLMTAPATRPIGHGGSFSDGGQTVELWYMLFDDVSEWTQGDMQESLNFKPFLPPALPAHLVLERNTWPALAFTRKADGSIRMFALTMELDAILAEVFNAQIK